MKKNFWDRSLKVIAPLLIGIILAGCDKREKYPEPEPEPIDPVEPKEMVITGEVSSISAFSATMSGTVNLTSDMKDFKFGILVSEKEDARINEGIDLESKELSSQNSFSVTTDRLKPDTQSIQGAFTGMARSSLSRLQLSSYQSLLKKKLMSLPKQSLSTER